MSSKIVEQARTFALTLRDERDFGLLDTIADALSVAGYKDATIMRLQAQGCIDDGRPAAALPILEELRARLPLESPEYEEAQGLLGRAWKQQFFDATDKTSATAVGYLKQAFFFYREGYGKHRRNTWHGVNVLAVAAYAARAGIDLGEKVDIEALSLELLAELDRTTPDRRDNWFHATRAEALLGLNQISAVEEHIGSYVQSSATNAFNLASTLRQFRDVWQLESRSEREIGIITALRAALLERKGGAELRVPAEVVRRMLGQPRPPESQLQKILGQNGTKTYDWMQRGLRAALAVGLVHDGGGRGCGTGFLLQATDLYPGALPENVVMTNAHVISDPPGFMDKSVAWNGASIAFEGNSSDKYYFKEIIWQNTDLDCTILRLEKQPEAIPNLVVSRDTLQALDPKRPVFVYIIGYPGARELAFSLQDNEVLDHEAPPAGTPPNPFVRLVQYGAPTEEGSSGSPVFDATRWRVVALHHAGAKDMARLNGRHADKWPANQGILIQSIIDAIQEQPGGLKPGP